jgi:hypothetical protein
MERAFAQQRHLGAGPAEAFDTVAGTRQQQ